MYLWKMLLFMKARLPMIFVFVRKLQERLCLAPEECAAFGDYMNDKEMLESVYYSYAMANAYPAIKDVARFEAKSNAENGVMRQIQTFIDQGLC